jgi:hypothetical protein
MQSVAPARGTRYLKLLNDFVTHGYIIACEPRYAIVRKPLLLYASSTETTHAYAYAIGCFMCGSVSWNPNDVNAHYCGNCHMFHDDG